MGEYRVGDYFVYEGLAVQITEILKDHPATYLCRYRVRMPTGTERDLGGMYITRRHRAPLLGECERHPFLGLVGIGCYCEECRKPAERVLVSDFSQQQVLLSTPELHGSPGVCLALALFWCKHRRVEATAGDWQTFRSPLGETQVRTDLGLWMQTIQYEVQAGLEGRAPQEPMTDAAREKAQFYKDKIGGFYRRHGVSPAGTPLEAVTTRDPMQYPFWEGGEPVGELAEPASSAPTGATTRAQINYNKAYTFKLLKIEEWAKDQGLTVVDHKFGFPFAAGKQPDLLGKWSYEAAEFATTHGGRSGLISVTGDDGGHTLGFVIQEDLGATYYRLFDPDYGEWVCASPEDFKSLLKRRISRGWSRKNRTWWVVRFA